MAKQLINSSALILIPSTCMGLGEASDRLDEFTGILSASGLDTSPEVETEFPLGPPP